MLFEKQQYQTDCVDNILQVLDACDVRNNDFSNLSTAIYDLWRKEKYTQFKKAEDKKLLLDVLMETGTGKTFTYLKTIFEIHKQFDKKKFIIVVPRTAIKLGVIQNIKLTQDYFYQQYKKYLKYIDYPKDGLSRITYDFLKTDDLCILITTNSAFNSDKNKINQRTETLFDTGSVWEGIKQQKPIIIIDEPHLLKGEETQKGLDKLTDSLQIRFGATFPKDEAHQLSNVAYSLDSISAFREYLVKGITVHTLINEEEQGGLKLSFTESSKKAFMVVYDINGVVHRKRLLKGDDIGVKTRLQNYKNVKATKINKNKVFLDNQTVLELSKGGYALGDEEIQGMIKTTIEKHFEKEEKLFKEGIKALSLFFIPNIHDFRESEQNPNPRIKTIFEKLYKKKRKEILANTKNEKYRNYLKKDINEEGKLQVHEGYFSGDKVSQKDKNSGLNKDDIGVNIILNEKEKLLSFDKPLRFIFSVWALQEGWDNPNIFTICKLADTKKETSRRQQVGRGLRIAVNQNGNRLTYKKLLEKENDFYQINTLDMVVSGKEKEFIQSIQQEIQEASYALVGDTITLDDLKHLQLNDTESAGLYFLLQQNKIIDGEGKILSSVYEFLKSNKDKLKILNLTDDRYKEILKIFTDNRGYIKDGNKTIKKVAIKQSKWKEFQELWETINKKSKIVYKNIEEENIIKKVAEQFNKENIDSVTIKRMTQTYNAQKDKVEDKKEVQTGEVNFFRTEKLTDFINFFVKDEKLFPFSFMVKLLNKIDKKKIKNNPKKAKERLLTILKDTLHGMILSNVQYEFLNTKIYPNDLQNEQGDRKQNIPYTLLGRDFIEEEPPKHLLYDTICFDSEIEKLNQQKDPQQVNKNKVTVFAKLPKISIPTPYKTYNPDFAYLIEEQGCKKLFLVVEAKGYDNESDIPPEEKQKIKYARRFFKALQNELQNIDISYKTRINRQGLINLLK